MLRKNRLVVLTVIAILMLWTTVGQAAEYNYNYGDNYNKNNYTVNYGFYDSLTGTDYNYTWQVITTPSKPSVSQKPSLPNTPQEPSKPSTPNKPSLPQEPSKPSTPNRPSLPQEPSKPPTPNIPGLSQIEQEVVRLANVERQKSGLAPFTASSELSRVARFKSEDMAKNNYFSHNSPTYGDPFNMMKSFGIKYTSAGENIAKGYLSAQSVMKGWMNSSGHRANILNPSFKTIGVGAYTAPNGTIYWTQMFTN